MNEVSQKRKHTWGSRRVVSRAPLLLLLLLVGLFMAVIGLCSYHGPVLAYVGCSLSVAVVGLRSYRGPTLAFAGCRGPMLASAGDSLAIIG